MTPTPSPTTTPTPAPTQTPAPSPTPAPAPSGALRWSATPGGQVTAVAGARTGHVYAGISTYPPESEGGVPNLVRLAPGGALDWTAPLASGGRVLALTAMPGGDVVAAICSEITCTMDDGSARLSLVRVRPDGSIRRVTPLSGDDVRSLDSDPGGRVLAIVAFWDFERNDIAHSRAFVVDDAGGLELDVLLDVARPVAAISNPSGELVVAGQDPATGRPVIHHLTAAGSVRRREVLDATGGAIDRVDVASDGAVAVAGWFEGRLAWGAATHAAQGIGGFVAVAGAAGGPLWSRAAAELRNFQRMPSTIGFSSSRLVVHTSRTERALADLRTYDAVGDVQWSHVFRGFEGTWVGAVAVSADGDVVVGARNAADAPFQGLQLGEDVWFVGVLAP